MLVLITKVYLRKNSGYQKTDLYGHIMLPQGTETTQIEIQFADFLNLQIGMQTEIVLVTCTKRTHWKTKWHVKTNRVRKCSLNFIIIN